MSAAQTIVDLPQKVCVGEEASNNSGNWSHYDRLVSISWGLKVREILETGTVNYEKSDPAATPDPKYALEGLTSDGQEVRIIFAPTDGALW